MILLDPTNTGEVYERFPVLKKLNELAKEKIGTKDKVELEVSDEDYGAVVAALDAVGDIFQEHAHDIMTDFIMVGVPEDKIESIFKNLEKFEGGGRVMEELTVKDVEFMIEVLDGYHPTINKDEAQKLLGQGLAKAFTITTEEESKAAAQWLDERVADLKKISANKREEATLLRAKLIQIRRGKQN